MTYVCPLCHYKQEIRFRTLSARQLTKAKRNWYICFDQQNGTRRILHKIPWLDENNWTAIHQVLNTGPFWDINAAGVCVDLNTANAFVRGQLIRFES